MEIRKVGILGAGKMAAEIFKLLSEKDFDVVLWTRRADAVEALDEKLKGKLRRRARKGGEAGAEAEARLARLTVTSNLEALRDVDLITESIIEIYQPKAELFAQLDRIVKPEAIFTTNTSSLAPSSLGRVTSRPDRFAGLHFFYPVSILSFTEVIPTAPTSPEVTQALIDFVRATGKRPVLSRESTGFVVNRLLSSYYNEATFLIAEGQWLPEQVDRVARRFAMMGPCESIDQIGVDIILNGVESADESWGRKDHVQKEDRGLRPWPELYFRLRADGRLGHKTGAGYYRYENGKPQRDPGYFERIWPEMSAYRRYPEYDEDILEKRLLYAIILEAAIVEELGVGTREDIDATLREVLGLEKGPFALAESLGLAHVREVLQDLEARFGASFTPRGFLKAQ